MNESKARDAVRDLMVALGCDMSDPSLRDTPKRVAAMWVHELLVGYTAEVQKILDVTFDSDSDGMVACTHIAFSSCCEHHMLPFIGLAHVAYIPAGGRVVGLSKLARVVDAFSRRLQIQERMTRQIADAIWGFLKPQGVGVVVEAVHQCMVCRGVGKSGSSMVTSELLGDFREAAVRQEFFDLCWRAK
uniref:GTP cyclohydrolase I n=1 Tax=viral metagenome TaxID=1070528 RepID=A0A6M3KSK2_9ZZZZ